jgi:hypothetical protein
MTRLRGRSRFGAAKARLSIFAKIPEEPFSRESFEEDGLPDHPRSSRGQPSGNAAFHKAAARKQAAILRNQASSRLIPAHESIINPRLSLAA